MTYTPRTATQIAREIAARIVARSDLSDIAEGSALAHIVHAFAEELAGQEHRLARIRDSFFIDSASGTDLDDRVADLPPSGLTRLGASAASGGALALTRSGAVGELTIPEGSTYGRLDDRGLVYRQVADAVFANGADTVFDVAVVCLATGSRTNAVAGAVSRVITAPGVLRAVNRSPLTNGRDEEDDVALRARARAYLSSLTGSTPAALEYLGRSFQAADRSRAAFVRIFEDPATPGLCELLVDDGSGLVGYRRPGVGVQGMVPSGGPPVLWHEAPAVSAITTVTVVHDGVARILDAHEYTSIPERGLVYVEPGVVVSGDTWTITKYDVWRGLPAELQAAIEGSTQDPLNLPGYRAAGVRVQVRAPLVSSVAFSMSVIPRGGRDFDVVVRDTINTVVEYLATLGPGETLFIARLIDRVMDSSDVLSVRFFGEGASCANDMVPASPRHVLRTHPDLVTAIPLPQEV